ncbi:MOSP complex formation periplasmic protein, TDE1658 family [Treponema sp.]|uniref:MOSP complex formation periplasmic protein, TDE1658 family n=1 Tax=Treponema sp. TaxID=166 RepID=UPI003F040687
MKKISCVLVFLFAAVSAFSQSDLQPLAVVKLNKSETITVKQLKTRASFIQKQYGMDSFSVEQKQALLENMIAEKLIAQAAAKDGLIVTDSQVDDAFLNTFSQRLGTRVSEAQLEDLIKKQTGKTLDEYIKEYSGMSKAEYKAYLKSQLVIQQYVFSKKQAEIEAVSATDEEIRSAYEMNKSTFVWNDMMSLFLVMVPKGSNDMAARALATDLRNKYKADSKKAEEIKNSNENGRNYRAGDITVAKTAQQAQQLGWSIEKLNELFGKSSGYLSEVTETSSDFQFYAVLKKYDAKMLSLNDIVQPERTETVYDYLKTNITSQKKSQYFTEAAQEISKSFDVPSNVERKKTGDALAKLLNWQ